MFEFPKKLYTDVRVENVFETNIRVMNEKIEDIKKRQYKAAFIRIYNGNKWYNTATTDVNSIQENIDRFAKYVEDVDLSTNPVVKKFEVNEGEYLNFSEEKSVFTIPTEKKIELLEKFYPTNEYIKLWSARYVEKRIEKEFYSSKGANLKFDTQNIGFSVRFEMTDGEKRLSETYDGYGTTFSELERESVKKMHEKLRKSTDFLKNAVEVKPGKYTVVLSQIAAGVFAHESFGHKSEADFMIGDKKMMEEWKMGKKVGSEILSIVDDGNEVGMGYTPFDDEGTKAKKTYLIKNGILSGRLHSTQTAASLYEEPTGNARAVSFEYEPIVRMTTTYIEPGNKTFEELISDIKEGIYVETIKYGTGMSTFTLAPSLAYMIRNGKLAEPVKISVVTGSVFEALYNIEGLSDDFKLLSFVTGGCGKFEQYPLPVGFGGPHVRVRNLNVQ